jgi:hypothetical protein
MGTAEQAATQTTEEHSKNRMSMGYFGTFRERVKVSIRYPIGKAFSSALVRRGLETPVAANCSF